jgi:hypothetical protein
MEYSLSISKLMGNESNETILPYRFKRFASEGRRYCLGSVQTLG